MERDAVGCLDQCCVRPFAAHPDGIYSTIVWMLDVDPICSFLVAVASSPPTTGVRLACLACVVLVLVVLVPLVVLAQVPLQLRGPSVGRVACLA